MSALANLLVKIGLLFECCEEEKDIAADTIVERSKEAVHLCLKSMRSRPRWQWRVIGLTMDTIREWKEEEKHRKSGGGNDEFPTIYYFSFAPPHPVAYVMRVVDLTSRHICVNIVRSRVVDILPGWKRETKTKNGTASTCT